MFSPKSEYRTATGCSTPRSVNHGRGLARRRRHLPCRHTRTPTPQHRHRAGELTNGGPARRPHHLLDSPPARRLRSDAGGHRSNCQRSTPAPSVRVTSRRRACCTRNLGAHCRTGDSPSRPMRIPRPLARTFQHPSDLHWIPSRPASGGVPLSVKLVGDSLEGLAFCA